MSVPALSINPTAKAPPAELMPMMRGPILAGGLIAVAFFGIFGGWAALAPLSTGAVASGFVSPASKPQVIDNKEGGILRAILVSEGERVAAGTPLVQLDKTQAEASYASGTDQLMRQRTIGARIQAEQSGALDWSLPIEVVAAMAVQPALYAFVESQKSLLEANLRYMSVSGEVADQQIAQLQSDITSLEAEIAGLREQKASIDQEVVRMSALMERQLVARSQVEPLIRQQVQYEADLQVRQSRIARTRQNMLEIEARQRQTEDELRQGLEKEATAVNNQIVVLSHQISAAQDILERTIVTSPVDGVVNNIRFNTAGGSVAAGQPILDVIPVDDEPVIMAQLSPSDIDYVEVGLPARVTLPAFSSRHLPQLQAHVTYVAADRTFDELTRQYSYAIHVAVPAEELKKYDISLQPGMQADVTVVAGSRTLLQYLTQPIFRAIDTAFVKD
ncbi:MAG: hypothetical protein ABS76_37345 [Pelagibacterium sp. SCN 64-44]|nr:MAG: hypothetical protein ABS76_37345 [Pelagibacterium sp. SCN 64-44]